MKGKLYSAVTTAGDVVRSSDILRPPVSEGSTPAVALSFDDGPGPSTESLLDVLLARGVKATFFLLGCNILRHVACAVRIAREGHVLGNHTFSHARPNALDEATFIDEIRRTDALLEAVAREAGTQLSQPPPCRLPYGPGPKDPRLTALGRIGRSHVHWTAQFGDWNDPEPMALAVRMRQHIQAQHTQGREAVLDLHDASRSGARRDATVHAVRLILRETSTRWFVIRS